MLLLDAGDLGCSWLSGKLQRFGAAKDKFGWNLPFTVHCKSLLY